MQGHVRKRGNTWSIVIDVGYDENGKRKQKWYSGFKTKKEAEARKTELVYKMNNGEFIDSKNMTVEDYLYKWLKDYAEQNVAPKTYKSYKDTIKNHLIPHLGKYKLDKLTPSIIQGFYSYCRNNTTLSNTTILYNHKILNQALKHAVQWQLLARNPCEATQPPRKNKYEAKTLNNEEVKMLLDYCKDSTIYTAILIAVTTGMRQAEIAGLRWEDVDLKKKTIYIKNTLQRIEGKLKPMPTKTHNSKRTVVMLDLLVDHLKKVRKKQLENKLKTVEDCGSFEYVCSWDNGTPMDPHYICKTFRKIIKKINIPQIRFHDLRHTHATLLLKEGIHPKIVSERLGHSQIGITLDLYSHATLNMQKSAVEQLEKNVFDSFLS